MSINKNDCLDCAFCTSVNIYEPNGTMYCYITGNILGKLSSMEVFEEDCEFFGYPE